MQEHWIQIFTNIMRNLIMRTFGKQKAAANWLHGALINSLLFKLFLIINLKTETFQVNNRNGQ